MCAEKERGEKSALKKDSSSINNRGRYTIPETVLGQIVGCFSEWPIWYNLERKLLRKMYTPDDFLFGHKVGEKTVGYFRKNYHLSQQHIVTHPSAGIRKSIKIFAPGKAMYSDFDF